MTSADFTYSMFLITALLLPELLCLFRFIRSPVLEEQSSHSSFQADSLEPFTMVFPLKAPHDIAYVEAIVETAGRLSEQVTQCIVAINGKLDDPKFLRDERGIDKYYFEDSKSKADNLNFALEYCENELVGIMDCDSIPIEDYPVAVALNGLNKHGCVQGLNISATHAQSTILATLVSLESLVSGFNSTVFSTGKNQISQFRGTNGYWRRSLLEHHGFESGAALEDIDITVRYLADGGSIRFEPSIVAIEEPPTDIVAWLIQRFRWQLGWGQIARKRFWSTFRSPKASTSTRAQICSYLFWHVFVAPISLVLILASVPSTLVLSLMLLYIFRILYVMTALHRLSPILKQARLTRSSSIAAILGYPIYSFGLDLLRPISVLGFAGVSFRWPSTKKPLSV